MLRDWAGRVWSGLVTASDAGVVSMPVTWSETALAVLGPPLLSVELSVDQKQTYLPLSPSLLKMISSPSV